MVPLHIATQAGAAALPAVEICDFFSQNAYDKLGNDTCEKTLQNNAVV